MTNDIVKNSAEISDVPVEHSEKAEKKAKSPKSDKRLEKLNALKAKYAKASEALSRAEKKASDIQAQIIKIENEIHAEEVAELEKACGEDIGFTDVARLVTRVKNSGLTFSELSELIGENEQEKINKNQIGRTNE